VAEKINPYIAGAPVVEARMFFGREDTFSWMTRSLAGKYVDHILVIHGQRRVGKTSVLKHLSRYLPEQYIPIFIDLQGRVSTTLDRFLWWLAREITRALNEQDISMPLTDREAFAQDADYFENKFLAALEEKLGDKRLLLTFDEFDTLTTTAAQEGLALPFLAILKRLMEHDKLNFIFSIGSAGRKLENMQATYTAFFKQALYKKISFLNIEDAHDLITQPVEGIIAYEDEAVDHIYKITSGHPYFIQLVCHELFSTCQKTDTWQVKKTTVEEVLDAVVERGTVNLKFVWDEANNLEKWVLASLALFEDGMDLPTLEDHLRKERVRFTRQDLETALLNLRGKDVITENNRFIIHLMRLWLQQNRSMEQVRDELEEVDPIVSRFLEIGHEYHDASEYERAINAFERALEAGPHNLEARQGMGAALLALGDYGESANEYEAALEISPEDVTAQAGYCDAYMALGDLEVSFNRLEEGEYAYRKVLQVNPKHADGLKRMAGIHHRRAIQAIIGGEDVALLELEKARRFG
jgi:tetratricopeptide (TPR) repeat protein